MGAVFYRDRTAPQTRTPCRARKALPQQPRATENPCVNSIGYRRGQPLNRRIGVDDHGLPRMPAWVLAEVEKDFAEKARVEVFVGLKLHFDIYVPLPPQRPITKTKPKKTPCRCRSGGLGLEPGGALLSHGGPHYHRRWAVSLPRSGWDRVVPARHGRQAILSRPSLRPSRPRSRRPVLASSARARARSAILRLPPRPAAGGSGIRTFGLSPPAGSAPARALGRCMAKPRGQLVRVSSARRRACTPRLSTWWSSRALRGALGPREVSSWEGLPA